MESELRVKLQILLENLDLNCKYFTGDEELCLRYGDNGIKDDGSAFCACNCDGKIKDCDFPIKELEAKS